MSPSARRIASLACLLSASGVSCTRWPSKQTPTSDCFDGLQRLGTDADDHSTGSGQEGTFARIGMSEELYFTWMGNTFMIQQKNGIVNQQCAELQAKLSADGFRSCILKGQGVAQLYPEEVRMQRQSGDIDVWMDASREAVIDYGMRMAPNKEFDQKHMHYHCFEETDVEAHWIPVKRNNPLWNRKLERYFDSERERRFTNVANWLCVPTADSQLVHQLLHVYGHYVYEGVGLRQVMDLFFAQEVCTEGRDKVLGLFK